MSVAFRSPTGDVPPLHCSDIRPLNQALPLAASRRTAELSHDQNRSARSLARFDSLIFKSLTPFGLTPMVAVLETAPVARRSGAWVSLGRGAFFTMKSTKKRKQT
jgi:hypothetical protein